MKLISHLQLTLSEVVCAAGIKHLLHVIKLPIRHTYGSSDSNIGVLVLPCDVDLMM